MSRATFDFGLTDEVYTVVNVSHETKRESDDRNNSVTDPRMGPALKQEKCATCHGTIWTCSGHFGVIDLGFCVLPKHLAKPVVAVMRKLCFKCFRAITGPRCACKSKPPKIRLSKKTCEIFVDDEPKTYEHVRELLAQIDSSEYKAIGCNTRLEKAFWTKLLVLPNTMRPWGFDPKKGSLRPDPITLKYNSIVRRVRKYETQQDQIKKVSLKNQIKNEIDQLFIRTTTVRSVTSDDTGILARLSAKSGYVRQNTMASRADQSGRGVIDPAPFFRADNVGISKAMASKLTVPMRVVAIDKPGAVFGNNISYARELIRANQVCRIEKKDGTRIEYSFGVLEYEAQRLGNGDVIHRKLQNGDDVVLNRQPTLHKGSIVGFRSVLIDDEVIRMTYPSVKQFNGDFDGDEMNVYVPQDLGAASEVRNLMSASMNVHSNQIGGTFLGAIMDTLVGSYLLTTPGVLLDRAAFDRFFGSHSGAKFKSAVNDQWDAPEYDSFPDWTDSVTPAVWSRSTGARFTGHQAFSTMIRKGLEYGDLYDESKPCVYRGELLWGRITKKDIGTSANSLIDRVAKISQVDAVTFLTKLDRGVLTWIASRGFSFTESDMMVDTSEIMQSLLRETQSVFVSCDIDDEEEIGARLKNAKENAMQRMIERMDSRNSMVTMVECGSKGQKANVGQIALCLGQQSVYAPLMKRYKGRASSAFDAFDDRPETRGFIYGNYHRGLTVEEFKMHAMAGRKAVIESGQETASTGYDGKKLQKSLEDLCVSYDFTVRNADGDIVQFKYGGNGYGPERLGVRTLDGKWKTHVLAPPPAEILFSPKHLHKRTSGYANEDQMWTMLTDRFKHEFCSVATYLSPYWSTGEFKWRDQIDWFSEMVSVQRQIYGSSSSLPLAMCHPGTAVGSAAAQSIYERMCQMTLDSFHKIGDKQSGYARYKELVMPKKTGDRKPSVVFYVADPTQFVRRHQKTTLEKVLKSSATVTDTQEFETIWFEVFENTKPPSGPKTELVFSEDRLRSRCVRLADFRNVIAAKTCPTHENATERWMIPPRIRVYGPFDRGVFVGPDKSTFPGVLVAGSDYVELVVDNETDLEAAIRTSFRLEVIDHARTVCSSVRVTQKIWGVRAARECLLAELTKNINVTGSTNHVALLADTLMRTGRHVGINVQGVVGASGSTLRSMGFERVTQFVTKAAVTGVHDPANQPSARLLIGERFTVGTGYTFECR